VTVVPFLLLLFLLELLQADPAAMKNILKGKYTFVKAHIFYQKY
jgi:hypothetical protein